MKSAVLKASEGPGLLPAAAGTAVGRAADTIAAPRLGERLLSMLLVHLPHLPHLRIRVGPHLLPEIRHFKLLKRLNLIFLNFISFLLISLCQSHAYRPYMRNDKVLL